MLIGLRTKIGFVRSYASQAARPTFAPMRRKAITNLLLYGASLGLLMVMLGWIKYRLLVMDHALELYGLALAIVFIVVGVWLGSKLVKPKTIVREEIIIREVAAPVAVQVSVSISKEAAGISERELDVLRLLAKGLSNEELAAQLFVSLNTVKTHLSNIYFKLDVKRRTQAVDKARTIGLID